jgi:hypothetical protein
MAAHVDRGNPSSRQWLGVALSVGSRRGSLGWPGHAAARVGLETLDGWGRWGLNKVGSGAVELGRFGAV